MGRVDKCTTGERRRERLGPSGAHDTQWCVGIRYHGICLANLRKLATVMALWSTQEFWQGRKHHNIEEARGIIDHWLQALAAMRRLARLEAQGDTAALQPLRLVHQDAGETSATVLQGYTSEAVAGRWVVCLRRVGPWEQEGALPSVPSPRVGVARVDVT
jgi:hypothetical protein